MEEYVGSMFIETKDGVVEVGMVETSLGVVPGGFRDAITHEKPRHLPSLDQMREALDLAKWSCLNQIVFTEGKVSNVPLTEWEGN